MQLMADRTSHRFVWFLGLVLIIARGLQIKAKDISIHQHTCDSDENEEGFCDTIDEIKYVQNDEIVDLKEEIPRIQKTEQVESLSQDLKEGRQSNEVHNNLSESNDKQVLSNSNTTTEWIGLQIPVVDGIKVGHIQEIEILSGIKRHMKTLSMRPLVFEIPDFLDEDECELIIAMAENKKLNDNPKKTDSRGVYYEDPLNTFKQWDLNSDEYIDAEEIVLIPGKMDLKFTKHNATEMMKTLNLDEDDNGKINLTEFKSVELEEIRQYIAGLLNDSSLRRIPNSRVSWLWHDEDELLRYQPDLLHGFHERLQAVTKIPKEIIQESEPMQVMQFEENNYQYCQQDSEPKFEGVPCCLYGDMKECRICRYITLAYFLNDVDEGGELVMPLANSKFEDDIMNNSGTWTGFFTYDKTTGSRNTFEVDVQFKMDGANKVIYGKGFDDSGEFELIDSLLTGNIIRFRKKYLNQGNKDFSIKYAGQLKGNTQIDGKWWVPGGEKMRGKFFMRHKGYEKWMNNAIGKCNSHEYCAKGKLVIKPKRGKAVMWYNHVPNDDGTWIGGLDNRMYYGHCDVTKGEKWMATNWINIDGDGEMELRAWKRGINLISDTRKHLNQNILQRMRRAEDNKAPDEIEEELNNDMENTQEWTFESRPKERHVLNAVVSLLESLNEEEMVAVSKKVHEKLQMLCVPLVLNQGGKISLVDGSKAE